MPRRSSTKPANFPRVSASGLHMACCSMRAKRSIPSGRLRWNAALQMRTYRMQPRVRGTNLRHACESGSLNEIEAHPAPVRGRTRDRTSLRVLSSRKLAHRRSIPEADIHVSQENSEEPTTLSPIHEEHAPPHFSALFHFPSFIKRKKRSS